MIFQITIIAAIALCIFVAGGMVWQALDRQEYPDSELPRWFVWIFREVLFGWLSSRIDEAEEADRRHTIVQIRRGLIKKDENRPKNR